MARRTGRTSPCDRGEAVNRLALAHEYAELAEMKEDEESAAARTAVVGAAILAGIAASDAVCCVRLGRRSSSHDHSDAIALLAEVNPVLSRRLATLVGNKPAAHYGTNFLSRAQVTASVKAMHALLTAASDAVSG